ncbi:MAG: pca operon transcription factor PcaQ [Rhodospirillales bacterium]
MIENGIKIRHLRCFREIVRFGSIKKAADVLSISQPAVSKTLSDLEALLGVQLMKRSRRGFTLTGEGEQFLDKVDTALSSLRSCIESVTTPNASEREIIRVGFLPAAGGSLIPDAVREYLLFNESHNFRIIAAPTPDLLERLRLGDLDFVVGHLSEPSHMHGLNFEYLYSECIGFVVRPGHPFLSMSPFDLQQLLNCSVLMPGPEAIISADVERFLLSKGIRDIPYRIECASHMFGINFTRATDAVWITSDGAIENDIREGRLGRLHVDTPDTTAAVGLTTRSSGPVQPAAREFMDILRKSTAGRLT